MWIGACPKPRLRANSIRPRRSSVNGSVASVPTAWMACAIDPQDPFHRHCAISSADQPCKSPVCNEKIRPFDLVQNRFTSATTVALLSFLLTLLASPFNSKTRLEAENAVLRRQLIILRRKVRGRVHFTNGDRLFLVQLYRWFPSGAENHHERSEDAPIVRQRRSILASCSAHRSHQVACARRRTESLLHASLSFRYTQPFG